MAKEKQLQQGTSGTVGTYMDVEIFFNGSTYSAPSLGITGVEEYREIKPLIQDKLASKSSQQKEEIEPLDYISRLLDEEYSNKINEKFEETFPESCDEKKSKKKKKDGKYGDYEVDNPMN